MEEDNKYYIYAYYWPNYALPRYIGKGFNDRAYEHLQKYCLNKKDLFHKKLNSLIDGGDKPEIEILFDNLSEDEALAQEQRLIKKYGLFINGGSLFNLTEGGEGISGYRHTQKFKDLMKGNKFGVGRKDKRKRLYAYLFGVKVLEFESINEAARFGYNMGSINRVLRGINFHAYNLQWSYQ